MLRVSEHLIERPRFPVIDAHNHLWDSWEKLNHPISELLDILDSIDVRVFVDLDGGFGEEILHRHLDTFKAAAPERFQVFAGVEWAKWPELGDRFGDWAAQKLREHKRQGAEGLKIWKPFGLKVKDQHGVLAPVDDPRLDPLWTTAAELDLPVMIHVADPVAFFEPLDRFNEQWTILHNYPAWHFPSPPYPSFETIITQFANLVARHPETTFIGAHVGCYAENLGWVGALLDRCQNLYVDISARVPELGRKPNSSRVFFNQYQNRILFGTDARANTAQYRIQYRFLETLDDYFEYSDEQEDGHWRICGMGLPDEILRKVYHGNAQRVLGLPEHSITR
jgi:predicted TIM-barrel fold metal-dependent hydrolase